MVTIIELLLTLSGIITPSLNLIGQFYHILINQKSLKSYAYNGHTDILVVIIELFRFLRYQTAKGIIPESLKSILTCSKQDYFT